ncbi:MAG: hypothetical protein GW795_05575 [Cyanobacteria bacterium]|nr:hypothetical protein [Cyanobacteria bacterium CG_2015-16_32_12]NCO79334.1 hypothetical protein [Cyanobacteria bacterium CG_2015-22_32_23]NCQ04571.1 hypothetical protein [Cyanobacteria bacterium CG_2015-09_32_10]NCQ41358.1 hypothetical protein [Cyanobacteria bacterium CG_2015-04_32_10]NCS84722.1 hypothetical protein [Cyanobacteria bacterium CG_2015-02_32_10]
MFRLKLIIFLLFFPVGLGLLWQSFNLNILPDQLISFTFFLFSIEQARMAVIDLQSYYLTKKETENKVLFQFFLVILTTIIIELCGFYWALFSVGWGAFLVIVSQIWFNFFAPLRVVETSNILLQNYNFTEKIAVLFADSIPLFLMILWLINVYPLTISLAILAITLTFVCVKYGTFIMKINR